MEEYLTQLDSIYHKMNDLRLVERNYYPLKRLVQEMLDLINKMLGDEEDPKKRREFFNAWSALSHTNSKEVEFVKYHQDQMQKKNAAKVRAKEYYKALNKAVEQIWSDISILLVK